MFNEIEVNKEYRYSQCEMLYVTSVFYIDNGSRIVYYKIVKDGEDIHFAYFEDDDTSFIDEWWLLLPDDLLDSPLSEKKRHIEQYKIKTRDIVKELIADVPSTYPVE